MEKNRNSSQSVYSVGSRDFAKHLKSTFLFIFINCSINCDVQLCFLLFFFRLLVFALLELCFRTILSHMLKVKTLKL